MFDEEEEVLYQRLVESCSGGSYNTVSDTGSNTGSNTGSDVDDIKDPTQNIVWTTPEGGGGPNYPNM